METFHIVWTIVLLVLFIGIVLWAWSGRRRKDFDEAARLPLEDDCVNKIDRENPEDPETTNG